MHQTVLVYADIDEGPKVGHVGDDTFQNHPQLQVFEVFDAFLEFGSLEFRAGVATGFFQLLQDVGDRWQAESFIGEFLGIKAFEEAGVTDQRANVALGVRSNALDQRVGFRVNGRAVQRVVAIHHTQKACGLFEGFFAQTADFLQRCPGFERAVFVTMIDDVLCQCGVEPGNTGQQRD